MAWSWAGWLHDLWRFGGLPNALERGQNQKWPASGPGGYISVGAKGVPNASLWGTKLEVPHKWARWLAT